ncbi:MAG: P-II family nitrogen regulator [Nitrososphaerales archaeon]
MPYKNMTRHNSYFDHIAVYEGCALGALKKIEAIVRRERFPDIDGALKQIGIGGVTFFDAEGRGRAKGREMLSDRGTRTYRSEYVDRTKLEIIVKDSDAQRVIDVILKNGKTGAVGDGKIFVSIVDEGYDIASGEAGEGSISLEEHQSFQVATH